MKSNMYDLLLDTKGYCFLCLAEISSVPQVELDSASASVCSLQLLTRHLEMDRSKLFNEKRSIPPYLLDKVKRSELKASLCEDCASLIEQFSELDRKVEGIKMQRTFCLKQIHQKLLNTDMTRITEGFQRSPEGLSSPVKVLEKIDILDALRREALEKCSSRASNPVVIIQKLPPKQINKVIPINYDNINDAELNSTDPPPPTKHLTTRSSSSARDKLNCSEDPSQLDTEISHVKIEAALSPTPSVDLWHGDNDDDDNFDISNGDTTDSETELKTKQKIRKRGTKCKRDKRKESSTTKKSSRVRKGRDACRVSNYSRRNLPYTFIKETHQYKCNLCPEEFLAYHQFYEHHRRAHRNSRFECTVCGKVFPHLGHYNRHQQSTHMGVRYKCPFCGHLFSEHGSLIRHHQTTVKCASELTPEKLLRKQKCSCSFCGKDFTSLGDLRSHWQTTHPKDEKKEKVRKLSEHLCDLCGKKFTYKCAMKRHKLRMHQVNIEKISVDAK